MSQRVEAAPANVDEAALPGVHRRDSSEGGVRTARSSIKSAEKPVERILIYRLGSLGDTIVALPCFHKLAEAFPNAERYVLTNIPVSSKAAALELILGNSGLVHSFIDYPIKLRSITQARRLSRQLRALRATTLVYLTPRRKRLSIIRDLLFFRLSGINRIIGTPLANHLQLDRVDKRTGLVEHECSRLARSLAELGAINLDDRKNWDLRLTEAERTAGDRAVALFKGGPFIAVNMGGKVVEKLWGEENWRRLLHSLSDRLGDHGLLFLGAADEAEAVDKVAGGWPSLVVNACGTLAPRESAAALRRAAVFVGHDSGPMHLAAAVGVTCVTPFGSLNKPRKWYPYGRGHRVIHRQDGVTNVRVEEMAAHVLGVLGRNVEPDRVEAAVPDAKA